MKCQNQKCQCKKGLILPIVLLLASTGLFLNMKWFPEYATTMFYVAIGGLVLVILSLIINQCQCYKANKDKSSSTKDTLQNNLQKVSKKPQLATLEECHAEIKKLQENLMTQQKMASVGLLTGGIAHEIKNPLNFINNFSRLTISLCDEIKEELEKFYKNPNDEEKDYINSIIADVVVNCEKIQEHGKRAESTVQNMLRQTRDTGETEKEPTDVNVLLEEFLNLAYHGMRAQHPEYNIKIEKNINAEIPKLMALPQSLGRVFLNLVNNGMYAANEKRIELDDNDYMPTIMVSTDHKDNHIIVKIKDNGPGIPEDKREDIFEPLFTTKPSGEGTGLGLAICKGIVVDEHGGEIKINSEVGKYTEFEIILPLEKN